jgi:SAM-dependent methyltransferase
MLKVEFGCGGNHLPGWVWHDLEGDGVDIRNPLPYADGVVDRIRAEHVCEHISGPEFLRFLDECFRILKVGGVLRLCMPVLDKFNKGMGTTHMRDLILNHGHQAAYTAVLIDYYLYASGFILIGRRLPIDDTDGHWKVISPEKDNLETYRVEAVKMSKERATRKLSARHP